MNRLFNVDKWKIIETELHQKDFRLAESIMSLGNSHMGMRGNFEETYSGDSHKGTYIAGVWFPDKTRVGWWKNGYPDYFGKVINAVNIIGIRVLIDGIELDLAKVKVKNFYRELDMKNGVLTRRFSFLNGEKETAVEVIRFLSIADKELASIRYSVTPINYRGEVTFIPYLDGDVRNEDANYEEDFWEEITKDVSSYEGHLVMKTKENPFGTPRFEVSAAMKVIVDGAVDGVVVNQKAKYIDNEINLKADKGQTVGLTKYIAVTTDRDYDTGQLVIRGRETLERVALKSFEEHLQDHAYEWAKRWEIADVEIDGDDEGQQGIRFNLFQLFCTYYGEDSRLNIGPKGFTGEKYGGATYWDTEAYALPLYLSTAKPEVAKNLCIYRYKQLDGAYHNAKKQGLAGALYPMVTFTGVECHNEWEITFEEIHRNGAIAYAIYNYVNYTGDRDYLQQYGIDVLTGISRFWADRVHFSKRNNQYMIHGVTGPNEYENNINNNWYTNRIAVWTLQYTVDTIKLLKESGHEDRIEALHITDAEVEQWQDIIARMYFPVDKELGIFVQHDTFLDKELMTVDELRKEDRPINQKWSWDKILRSCFIKQADVLQGLYFLNHEFTMEEKRNNFEFYEPMTVHESSLSPSIHSVLAAELGMEEKAFEMYHRTARLDLDNYNNDTEDGLHITSMTGAWLSIVQGFAGMRTANERLSFSPFIPKAWDRFSFNIIYRNHSMKIEVSKEQVTITQKGPELSLALYDDVFTLPENGELRVSIKH